MNDVVRPVLVVDDDPDNRALLKLYLVEEGLLVIETDTGEKALEIMKRQPVGLVLLDVLLPRMSGYELCRIMRADPALAATPVIVITAQGDPGSRTRAFEADVDQFVAKPVHRPELIARVRSLLRRRWPGSTA